jgi:hypothetical protein
MILLSAKFRDRVHGMFRLINRRSAWLAIVLGFGVLEFGVLGFVPASHAVGQAPAVRPTVVVNKHSVKLSWAASVPASKSARDAVVGYNVYRSTKSHDRNAKRINSAVCVGTTFTDRDAEAGNTYFYVTRGVNAKGVESGPSNEVKVVMPPR